MKTRCTLFAALLAFSAAGGCTHPTEQPAAPDTVADEKPKAAGLPEAPMPRAKKTTAELLVGKWWLVKQGDRVMSPLASITGEYQSDGTFLAQTVGIHERPQKKAGTYQLIRQTIRITSDKSAEEPSKTWDVDIESLTEDELVTLAGPTEQRQRSVWQRTK